jgi:hypothetical protein
MLELFKTSKGILYEQVDCLFDRWCFLCCRVRNLTRCTSGNTAVVKTDATKKVEAKVPAAAAVIK